MKSTKWGVIDTEPTELAGTRERLTRRRWPQNWNRRFGIP